MLSKKKQTNKQKQPPEDNINILENWNFDVVSIFWI